MNKINDPFPLKTVKQEIKKAELNNVPISLSKVTIKTIDAQWMVEQVELLQEIAYNFKKSKGKR